MPSSKFSAAELKHALAEFEKSADVRICVVPQGSLHSEVVVYKANAMCMHAENDDKKE